MSVLEDKEKALNKLKAKVDTILRNNHPAADKIEVWTWSIHVHLCRNVRQKHSIYTHL